jgi:O-antigen/teichoic acid export membrane protein
MPGASVRNTFFGFVSAGPIQLSAIVGGVVAPGCSGPRGMGVLAYATWCIVIAATIADLGIGTVLQRFVPNLRAAGEHDEPGRMSSPVNNGCRHR